LELTDAAKTHLVQTGYDPAYGARPLKRTIQREIETALGRLILQGDVKDNSLVRVDYDTKTSRLTFHSQKKG
jgi:ATP-dependent Clp protease ATP-binding subunit ClpB